LAQVIELLGNIMLVALIVIAIGLCVIMPLIVFAAIKDLKNRGAK
jgi:hypothetical protein